MRVLFYGAKPYDRDFFTAANRDFGHEITFVESKLSPETARLAAGFPAVCVFVNDDVGTAVSRQLAAGGTRLIALRCAGTNNVDLAAANKNELTVVRVPAYSPEAVAEHAVALMLALNRKICRANARIHEMNFALDGLLGFNLHNKTVGIVGLGKIGTAAARILNGFGCRLLGTDPNPCDEAEFLGIEFVELNDLLSRADIVSLHCPLTKLTWRMINAKSLERCKPGVMLINTGRGGLVDTQALIESLKRRVVGYVGLDVYEEEGGLFFDDRSNEVPGDDVFARLLTFPNVLITGHQGFFTREALENIARVTLQNISDFAAGNPQANRC